MIESKTLSEKTNILQSGIRTLLRGNTTLRPAQSDAFAAMDDLTAEQIAHSYFKLPTGFGKTVMFSFMADSYLASLTAAERNNNKVVVLVPRLALSEQTVDKIDSFTGLPSAEFNSQTPLAMRRAALESGIIISTYQSMDKMIKMLGADKIGLVIADEVHHSLGEKKSKSLQEIAKTTPIVGFTATPTYSDGRSVSDILGTEIFAMNIPDAVATGMLAPVKNILYRTSLVFDASTMPSSSKGEFDYSKLPASVKMDTLADEIASIYMNGGDGDTVFRDCKTMINCPNIEMAITQAARINELAGTPIAVALSSKNKNFETLKNAFAAGKYNVACQVNTLTEGFDDPAVSLCINYPSRSAVRIEQAGGRALRLNPADTNKHAYVLDTIFRGRVDEELSETLTTAHVAGQVLFQNVAGGFLLPPPAKSDDREDYAGIGNGIPRDNTHADDYTGGRFDVITDAATLFDLSNAHKKWLAEKTENELPQKTSEWLSATDLIARGAKGNFEKITEKLTKLWNNGNPVSDFKDAIQPMQSRGYQPICLHVSALDLFLEIIKNDELPDKGDEWFDHIDLAKNNIIGGQEKIRIKLKEIYSELNKHILLKGHIQYVKRSTGRLSLCLHKNYIDEFCNATEMKRGVQLEEKTSKWLSASDLVTKYLSGGCETIKRFLEDLNIRAQMPGLIQQKQSGTHRPFCLHKDAIDEFCKITGSCRKEDEKLWVTVKDLNKDHFDASIKKITDKLLEHFEDASPKNKWRKYIRVQKTAKIRSVWLHIDAVEDFRKFAGYDKRGSIKDKTPDWLTPKELIYTHIGADHSSVLTMLEDKCIQALMGDKIQLRKAAYQNVLCLHVSGVENFCKETNFKQKGDIWISVNELDNKYYEEGSAIITKKLQECYYNKSKNNKIRDYIRVQEIGERKYIFLHVDAIDTFCDWAWFERREDLLSKTADWLLPRELAEQYIDAGEKSIKSKLENPTVQSLFPNDIQRIRVRGSKPWCLHKSAIDDLCRVENLKRRPVKDTPVHIVSALTQTEIAAAAYAEMQNVSKSVQDATTGDVAVHKK